MTKELKTLDDLQIEYEWKYDSFFIVALRREAKKWIKKLSTGTPGSFCMDHQVFNGKNCDHECHILENFDGTNYQGAIRILKFIFNKNIPERESK